jgi:glycosyltransferase involved in cell wall biosynthesis
VLDFCHQKAFNHIHSATPGPVGLAALAIAKNLKIPISGTYHTAIPQYVHILTGSRFMEEITWKYILWYYNQLDMIYVPSLNTGKELEGKGIDTGKISVYPRGIDINQFHPSKRNGFFKSTVEADNKTKFLYTGRVSKEKNLHLLVRSYKKLAGQSTHVFLTIVGEGPYLKEMKAALRGFPCLFTGYLDGEDLSAAYASSDVFVFPSTTDTFGNVVLEAQASGLPVIVTDQGGPSENMIPEKTGYVIKGGCEEELLHAMAAFAENVQLVGRMSASARAYMEDRSFKKAFLETWELFREMTPGNMSLAS